MASCIGSLGLLLSLTIQILDQSTDAFSCILYYVEGQMCAAVATLVLIFFPGAMIAYVELRGVCRGKGSVWKALAYLVLAPLWTIIIHLYSLCDERYVKKALLFKTVEGFLEAGPQLALQLSLLFRGQVTETSLLALGDPFNLTTKNQDVILEMLGRTYESDHVYWFGWVHVISVCVSFISIFSSTVFFNDIEQGCALDVCGKVVFSLPYFFFTLIYRCFGMALLITYFREWSSVILFFLFFVNFLCALNIGDGFPRSVTYGFWSLFVPVGYNRDPGIPLGYQLINDADQSDLPIEDSLTQKKSPINFRNRARYFLTFHILTSAFILGGSLLTMLVLVHNCRDCFRFNPEAIFSKDYLTFFFLPVLGISFGLSTLLVRPYYRFECTSNPELSKPKGNVIL
ncbi:uncharacterized protein [Lepeophtheirus salmonis]|uniref:XK-related protein n=1 Tax=Lepeophtheirus salmonis TaxID=72036 RepID=A0A0K2TGE9_LEPSM|nr:uncharacterized protein LOC121117754 [Lepeophtheirus salmonis]